MLIQHIAWYDVGEQIGRNRQAVRSLFQVDKRGNLKATVGGIAVRRVEFIEKAVCIGLTDRLTLSLPATIRLSASVVSNQI